MDKNRIKNEEKTRAKASSDNSQKEDEEDRMSEIRQRLEPLLRSFDGREMWYNERLLQFQGIAHITTDEWGVRVRFESENFREIKLSGRWDILVPYSNGVSAMYCDWSLCLECPWPELGISYG